jgi:hypothetical protein
MHGRNKKKWLISTSLSGVCPDCCVGSGSNTAAAYVRVELTGGQSVTAFRRFVRGRMASASDVRSRVEKQSRAKDYVGRVRTAGRNEWRGGDVTSTT